MGSYNKEISLESIQGLREEVIAHFDEAIVGTLIEDKIHQTINDYANLITFWESRGQYLVKEYFNAPLSDHVSLVENIRYLFPIKGGTIVSEGIPISDRALSTILFPDSKLESTQVFSEFMRKTIL